MEKEAFIGYSNNKRFYYPLENLKKHLISLGSSGSGKTVLLKALIEEAAFKKIPSIIIDTQGDLASLAILGNKDDLEEYNIGTYEQFKKDTRVVVFTPVSSKGIPISINPLKLSNDKFNKEEIIPILNQIATAITKFLGYDIDTDKGKASEAVLYSILNDHYTKGIPIDNFNKLVDILSNLDENLKQEISQFINSDKDLKNLIRKIKYLTVGEKELLFQEGISVNIPLLLGKNENKTQISIIYLNTLQNQKDKEFFISTLTTSFYQWMLSHPSQNLQCLYVIDEIAHFIPAGSEKPMPKPILRTLFKQARKYGIGCLISTQNPGDIDYKAFAQFGSWAIGRLTTKQDQKKVQIALKSNIDTTKLAKLKPGNFLLFAPDLFEKNIEFNVRTLITKHTTLNEDDVKNVTFDDIRDYYKIYMGKKKKIKESTSKDEKRGIPVIKAFFKVNQLAEKYRKKVFGKEEIDSINVIFKPIIQIIISSVERKFLGKNQINKYILLFNGNHGNLHQLKNNFIRTYEGFNLLLSLNDYEIKIIKDLIEKKKPVASEEIAHELHVSKSFANKELRALLDKGFLSFNKVSKHHLWFPLINIPILPLKKMMSENPVIEYKEPRGKIDKTKVNRNDLGKLIRNWFPNSEITEYKVIYIPNYEIIYQSKKRKRIIEINGITGNIKNYL